MSTQQKMRRITLELTVEFLMPEAEIVRMGAEMDETLSDMAKDGKESCLVLNAVMYDAQDPIAQFQYFNEKGQKDKRIFLADAAALSALGYKTTQV